MKEILRPSPCSMGSGGHQGGSKLEAHYGPGRGDVFSGATLSSKIGSAGRGRTGDLRLMRPTSFQLLHRAEGFKLWPNYIILESYCQPPKRRAPLQQQAGRGNGADSRNDVSQPQYGTNALHCKAAIFAGCRERPAHFGWVWSPSSAASKCRLGCFPSMNSHMAMFARSTRCSRFPVSS